MGCTGSWEHMSMGAYENGSTGAWEHIILETDYSAPAAFPCDSRLTAASTSFNETLEQSS